MPRWPAGARTKKAISCRAAVPTKTAAKKFGSKKMVVKRKTIRLERLAAPSSR